MHDGWLPVPREHLRANHELHPMQTGEPACSAFAFLDLLGMARFTPGDGLERGQLRVSCRYLAKRWCWSKSKAARFMSDLRDAKRVTSGTQVGREQPVVTILNYDRYVMPWIKGWDAIGTQVGREMGQRRKNGRKNERKARTRETEKRQPSEPEQAYVEPVRIRDIIEELRR